MRRFVLSLSLSLSLSTFETSKWGVPFSCSRFYFRKMKSLNNQFNHNTPSRVTMFHNCAGRAGLDSFRGAALEPGVFVR